MNGRSRIWLRLLAAAPLLLCLAPLLTPPERGQAQDLGSMISPGKLSKAHAKLEGLDNCQKCHEPGRKVTAEKCLACHKPIAERIAARKGVHRDVKDDCVACHVEHAGVDAELRPFDPKKFDHLKETGFPLDGKHAPVKCEGCHKTRSFLAVQPACAACHVDAHKGRLGNDCAHCHTTAVAFKETKKSFDHTRTAYPLTGAHLKVQCATCHKTPDYKVAKFDACNDCHKDPHQKPLGVCASCHTTDSFKATRKIEHDKTAFPLLGKHATVPCATCHVKPATEVHLKFGQCADCHQDPHKGVFKGTDCKTCHNEAGFKKASPFDHAAKTGYALDGKHSAVACAACHKSAAVAAGTPLAKMSVDFRGAKKDCASCHKDPHKGELGVKCESCHTTASFKVATFQHPRFPDFFTAKHSTAPCESCHKTAPAAPGQPAARLFKGVSTECATCHKDAHAGQLGTACQTCHTNQEWKIPGYQHKDKTLATFFAGKHSTAPCEKCHKPAEPPPAPGAPPTRLFKGVATACATCHKDPHLGQLGTQCQTCHGSTETWKLPGYKHQGKSMVEFFAAKHGTVPCADCHKEKTETFPAGPGTAVVFKGTPTRCAACHKDAHNGTLGTQCENCHNLKIWKNASRAFHKNTIFPLEGRHLTTPCGACHLNGVTKGTPNRCFDCHWIRHRDDKYETRLGNECGDCHRPTSWTAVIWNHAQATGFPLTGVHATLACQTCHRNNVFTGLSPQCVSCHQKDYDGTRNPNHAAAGFPTTCETCHRASDPTWTGSFNHASFFALVGQHATQPCAACHRNNVYAGTARDCYGCHKANYDQTHNPPHASAGFPTTCDTCHRATDVDWSQSSFNHATTFALVGVHATQPCTACHKNNVYRGTPRDCYGCHKPSFDSTHNPNHTTAGFPTTCDTCHRPTDANWTAGSFNHSTFYQLVGVHAAQPCAACHKTTPYSGTPTLCSGCHLDKYNATTTPRHTSAGFPTTCDTCHRATDANWNLGVFNHTTFYQLVGVHATQPCSACHANNRYQGTPTLCSGCHLARYNATTNPNHTSAGFPTTCDSCHRATDANWNLGVFNHTTFYQLVGVHASQPCAACHPNNRYAGTPTLCSGCHIARYNATTNPNHVSAGFPTTCDTCHRATDANWNLGVFNHSQYYALVGVHASQPCSACHPNNRFPGTPTLCSGCHIDKYNATTDPNHAAAGFPTTCDTCHRATDTSWSQGTFNHSQYYALVGVHASQPCVACHINNQYPGTPTLCSGCHIALYNSANNPNHVAAGFPTTCDTCHRPTDTSWTQGTFNHTWFPITSGNHSGLTCNTCHTTPTNFALFSCLSGGCHPQAQTNSNHSGVSGYVYTSTACYSCHPNGQAGNRPAILRRKR